MGQYRYHVFVCTEGKTCARQGGEHVHGLLKDAVKSAGLKEEIRVNHSGCLNQCGHGPMIVVYPDDVWYSGVDPSGAKRIAREHLLGDQPVERYRYKPDGPGNNKR